MKAKTQERLGLGETAQQQQKRGRMLRREAEAEVQTESTRAQTETGTPTKLVKAETNRLTNDSATLTYDGEKAEKLQDARLEANQYVKQQVYCLKIS